MPLFSEVQEQDPEVARGQAAVYPKRVDGNLELFMKDGDGDVVRISTIEEITPDSFLSLSDSPDSYAGQAGEFIRVKSTEDGVEFAPIDLSSAAGWTDAGTVVRLTTVTDTVAIGAAAMAGAEKLRLVGDMRIEGALVLTGNLTVSGTTTTVNSTVVDIADRMVHVNHSTGVVAVPSLITGFSVHRGATAGPTDRDHAAFLWRGDSDVVDPSAGTGFFAVSAQTGGDDSTIGNDLDFQARMFRVSRTAGIGIRFETDNSADIGAAGATRPRTGYFGTSLVVGSTITIDGVNRIIDTPSGGLVVNGRASSHATDKLRLRAQVATDWGGSGSNGEGYVDIEQNTTLLENSVIVSINRAKTSTGNGAILRIQNTSSNQIEIASSWNPFGAGANAGYIYYTPALGSSEFRLNIVGAGFVGKLMTNTVERLRWQDGSVVFNNGLNDVDTIIKGDNDANLGFFDAGLDAVGIGGVAVSGVKLTVTGTERVTGKLSCGMVTPTVDTALALNAISETGTGTYARIGLESGATFFGFQVTRGGAGIFAAGFTGGLTDLTYDGDTRGKVRWFDSGSVNRFDLLQSAADGTAAQVNISCGNVTMLTIDRSLTTTPTRKVTLSADLVITQPVRDATTPKAFLVTGGAHTAITAATEDIGADFDFSATKTWAAGAGPLAKQREIIMRAPTYNGNAGGALTISDAATLTITGAPVQGTNITLSRTHALWVEAGRTLLGGELEIDGDLNHDGTNVGFYGVAPVARSAGWTITNDVTDRSFDANTADVAELSDVVATLIRDLAATGIIGAVA